MIYTSQNIDNMKLGFIAKVKEHFKHLTADLSVVENAPVVINPRMRTTAGRAHHTLSLGKLVSGRIEINAKLLEQGNEGQFYQTLGHETAHLIAIAIQGSSGVGHGPTWRFIMRAMGLEPRRTHQMPWDV